MTTGTTLIFIVLAAVASAAPPKAEPTTGGSIKEGVSGQASDRTERPQRPATCKTCGPITADDVIRLKQAGISEETIQMMIGCANPKEKSAAVPTPPRPPGHTLTVNETIRLKKAGVSDGTIQLLLIQDFDIPRALRERAYAYDHIGTWRVKGGIIYSTGKSISRIEAEKGYSELTKALEILYGRDYRVLLLEGGRRPERK